ncbi:MAG TPA: phenylalanine--tRNA ligase subunit beta [Candidatus Saccharimonadales bacterium]
MKISLNSIRAINGIYGSAGDPAPNGVDDIVMKIGDQLGAVEEVISYGERFKGVLVAKIVSCVDHPDADRLHICKIDDGGKAEGLERDENGHVQVVCGAPNAREGITVAWLPPGATVPSSFGNDPFVLESRPLRGVISNGMLASPKELTIGDNHEGIMELDTDAAPGTSFAAAYDLEGDVVIDIENKMFTHRPDCFGQLGVARELEGIQHRPYKSPDWYCTSPEFPGVEADELKLEVRNEIPELVPRFTAITMRDVTVKPSPVWLQIELSRVGIRPINNIVDYSNFFMIETGQPIHIYDYDKVVAQDADADHATIVVRHPRKGEKILLLNGKEIEPRDEAIMIATNDKLIGVGGVMGGGDTEVDQNTKNIIIEVANFDMYSIRRTSMVNGLFTDAVTRFNKGQSPLQNLAILAKTVDEIRRYADGKVASSPIDDNHLPNDMIERRSVYPAVKLTVEFINARLGLKLSGQEAARLLQNVEFEVENNDDELTVIAPFWRTDVAIAEDVVEEVGRLYGFDHLPLELPARDLTPAKPDPMFQLKDQIRTTLQRAGANEVLTYSFVHGNLLDKVGQNRDMAYRLSNAISPDLQYYRMSLMPSLMDLVHSNIKAGYGEFALFEMGKAHVKGFEEDGLPREFERLAFVYAADKKAADRHKGAPYYQARKYLLYLLSSLGIAEKDVIFEPLKSDDQDVSTAYYEPGRSATVTVGDKIVGRVGEYKASVRKALKMPDYCAGFELGLTAVASYGNKSKYIPLPRFPKVEQDICLRVPAEMQYQQLAQFVEDHLLQKRPDQTLHTLRAIDIYQSPEDKDNRNITFRLSIASYERTLTAEEVNSLLDHVAQAASEAFGAERV